MKITPNAVSTVLSAVSALEAVSTVSSALTPEDTIDTFNAEMEKITGLKVTKFSFPETKDVNIVTQQISRNGDTVYPIIGIGDKFPLIINTENNEVIGWIDHGLEGFFEKPIKECYLIGEYEHGVNSQKEQPVGTGLALATSFDNLSKLIESIKPVRFEHIIGKTEVTLTLHGRDRIETCVIDCVPERRLDNVAMAKGLIAEYPLIAKNQRKLARILADVFRCHRNDIIS